MKSHDVTNIIHYPERLFSHKLQKHNMYLSFFILHRKLTVNLDCRQQMLPSNPKQRARHLSQRDQASDEDNDMIFGTEQNEGLKENGSSFE
jgi:hypothetical protein